MTADTRETTADRFFSSVTSTRCSEFIGVSEATRGPCVSEVPDRRVAKHSANSSCSSLHTGIAASCALKAIGIGSDHVPTGGLGGTDGQTSSKLLQIALIGGGIAMMVNGIRSDNPRDMTLGIGGGAALAMLGVYPTIREYVRHVRNMRGDERIELKEFEQRIRNLYAERPDSDKKARILLDKKPVMAEQLLKQLTEGTPIAFKTKDEQAFIIWYMSLVTQSE